MNLSTKIPRVLFIGDKWCAGKYEWGVSEWEKNLASSLESTGLAETQVFHFDEYYREHGKRGDEAFLEKVHEWKPDMVFIVIYSMPGSAPHVPDWPVFEKLRELHVPIAAMWEDFVHQQQIRISRAILPYTTLNVVGDTGSGMRRARSASGFPEKYFHIWTPKDPRIWNDPGKKRDIEVSYFGSPRANRMKRIQALEEAGFPVVCGGGEANAHLSTEQYADRFQRSKITISFSRGNFSHVLNARPFEAMSCGAMVLEQESCEAPVRFIPYEDYVPFSNDRDLIKKTKYYLSHNEDRERIAKNGREKMRAIYSAKHYWEFVIGKTLNKDYPKIPNGDAVLRSENLKKAPAWQAWKLKTLYAFQSSRRLFDAYRAPIFFYLNMKPRIRRKLKQFFFRP